MTERKRAEASLRASEERWRAVFEKAMVGIVTLGLDGRFARANASYQRITGYTEDELRNLTVLDITHEEDRDLIQLLPAESDEARSAPVHEFEKRYRRKDGEWSGLTSTRLSFRRPRPHRLLCRDRRRHHRSQARRGGFAASPGRSRASQPGHAAGRDDGLDRARSQPADCRGNHQRQCGFALARRTTAGSGEVRQALGRIVRDGTRRRRGHSAAFVRSSRKVPPRRDCLDINEAIREVIALTQTEVQRQRRQSADTACGRPAVGSGGSGPAAAGDHQPDHQCRRGDERQRLQPA